MSSNQSINQSSMSNGVNALLLFRPHSAVTRIELPYQILGGLDEGKMFGGVRCVAERTLDTILMVSIDVSRLCILVGSRISRGTVDS